MKFKTLLLTLAIITFFAACKETASKKEDNQKEDSSLSGLSGYFEIGIDSESVLIYYQNAIIDTLYYRQDSVIATDEDCNPIETAVCSMGAKFTKGEFFITDKDKALINKTPYEDIKFLQPEFLPTVAVNPECNVVVFDGYSAIENAFTMNSFKDSYNIEFEIELPENLIPAKQNGKWGIINTGGETIKTFEFDSIMFYMSKYMLYNDGNISDSIVW